MARSGYTNEGFNNLLLIHGECHRIAARTCRVFADRYPDLPRPTHKTIHAIMNNLQVYGSFKTQNVRERPIVNSEVNELIALTFDGAVVEYLMNDYYVPLLFDLTNPDGAPIGATFFVSHEYTDYNMVVKLYNQGFEIGVNSISKYPIESYWKYATVDILQDEFGGEKEILSNFAKIPKQDILGVRTPQYLLAGDTSFQAYRNSSLIYDSSWPSFDSPIFPYSLDFKSTQDCKISVECPEESFPGQWVLPINSIQGENRECYTLASCGYISSSKQEIMDWLNREVGRRLTQERAPMTMVVEPFWFELSENIYPAFREFLVSLVKRGDVFLVTQSQILDWIKNPVSLEYFKTQTYNRSIDCSAASSCRYVLNNSDIRYMISCNGCPKNYPWLGNPFGK